jgi:Lar family restriction alleviation protein
MNYQMSKPIDPCPFCSSNNLDVVHQDFREYQVACMDCEALGPVGATSTLAINQWNRSADNSAKRVAKFANEKEIK